MKSKPPKNAYSFTYLGLDVSSACIGYAIYEPFEDKPWTIGHFVPVGENLPQKILSSQKWLKNLIEQYRIDFTCIEKHVSFFASKKSNANTIITLASLNLALQATLEESLAHPPIVAAVQTIRAKLQKNTKTKEDVQTILAKNSTIPPYQVFKNTGKEDKDRTGDRADAIAACLYAFKTA